MTENPEISPTAAQDPAIPAPPAPGRKPRVWTPEKDAVLARLYLEEGLGDKEIAEKMGLKKFQVHDRLDTLKLRNEKKRVRRIVARKTGGLVKLAVDRHKKFLERTAERAEKGTDKAFQFIENASTARELQSAVSATKGLVELYKLGHGIEGKQGAGTQHFHFNFAHQVQPKAVERVVEKVIEGEVVNG